MSFAFVRRLARERDAAPFGRPVTVWDALVSAATTMEWEHHEEVAVCDQQIVSPGAACGR